MNRPFRAFAIVPPTVLLAASFVVPAGAAVTTSSSFAGYQLVSTKITTATATFTVPTIRCKQGRSGVGPSIVIVSTVNKAKNTYTYSGAGVGVGCVNNTPVYESILIVNGASSNDLMLAAGDRVTVSVTMQKRGTKVTLNDLTSKAKKVRKGAGKHAAQVYIGDNGLQINNAGVHLDPFTTTTVTHATIDGRSLTAMKAKRTTWKRGSTTLVTASKLKNGKSFQLTFRHA